MATAQAPFRRYNFTDARLIELCIEKIAFARRDETELATVGILEAWVDDFETRALAFGAMPTDTIELGEQKQATEEKDVDADMVKDKLKELRSAAKRALGEKSVEYKKFGFLNLDDFGDSDLLKMALVVPALTAKHAAVLATKGWEAADNTELASLLSTFVGGIQNQVLEVASRDDATEDRIKEGNEIYDQLANELCEAGKGYWRTRSESKYNDYEIFNTSTGSDTFTATLTLELTPGQVGNFDISAFDPEKIVSILFESINANGQNYAGTSPTVEPDGPVLNVNAGESILKTAAEVETELGFNETHDFLNVKNNGVTVGTFKVTLTVHN